jgi:hypothetical protein
VSENKKSFWSGIPGLVTGLAGLLTGIVGLVTVLIQLDVIGGKDDATPNAVVTTTVAPGGTAGTTGGTTGGAAGATTTISGRLTAEPTSLKLATGEREKTITVRNLTNASLTVLKPEYTGADSSAFSTDSGCTNVVLPAGRSCTLKVTLSSTGPLKTYKAELVLEAKELPQATKVPVEASTLL